MARLLLLPPLAHPGRPASNALLAKGFRPFFLLAALFALLAVPLWLLLLDGRVGAPPYLDAVTFHAHEMLHGYTVAVLAGFLLTAVGNWTERETATGVPLLGLALLWLAGRVAMLASSSIPPFVTAAIDLSFVPALMMVLTRPLVSANNRRNFVMLGVLGALWLTNVVTHVQALGALSPGGGRRAMSIALDVVVLLMSVMAARVFPMFTKNATGSASMRSLPMLDRASHGALLLATLLDVASPEGAVTAAVFGGAGLLLVARSVHWGARQSWRNPLLWCLHVGYGWLCLGVLLRSASLAGAPISSSLATHALTVGAIGGLTLGMMARVALGHTGRMLAAPTSMSLAFIAINLAALVRCFGPLLVPSRFLAVLVTSGALWELAFAIFVAKYAPILLQRRVDGRPG